MSIDPDWEPGEPLPQWLELPDAGGLTWQAAPGDGDTPAPLPPDPVEQARAVIDGCLTLYRGTDLGTTTLVELMRTADPRSWPSHLYDLARRFFLAGMEGRMRRELAASEARPHVRAEYTRVIALGALLEAPGVGEHTDLGGSPLSCAFMQQVRLLLASHVENTEGGLEALLALLGELAGEWRVRANTQGMPRVLAERAAACGLSREQVAGAIDEREYPPEDFALVRTWMENWTEPTGGAPAQREIGAALFGAPAALPALAAPLPPQAESLPATDMSVFAEGTEAKCDDGVRDMDELRPGGPAPAEAPSYAEVLVFARDEMKGKERAAVEALCKAGGRLPLADLAIKIGATWDDPVAKFKETKRRVDRKLDKIGWEVFRHDNEAVIKRKGLKRG